MKKIAFLLLICFLFACSRQAKNIPHSGESLLNKKIYLDSVIVDASYTSGWGNFYLVDSIITFADTYYSKFYDYKANSGDFVAEHFGERTIGVHVRRTDNNKAIQSSPLELFIKAIRHELEIDGNVRFFVASDSDEVKHELLDRFGDRIITVFESCDRNSRQGIENGLTDLYLLSRT